MGLRKLVPPDNAPSWVKTFYAGHGFMPMAGGAEETPEEKAAREAREAEAAKKVTDDKQFTQADLDRIATREKEQGKQAASRDLAERLGVSIEEAEQIIKDHKEASDAKKDEATRAREAADAEKQTAAQEKAAAAKERHDTKVERMLIRAGVPIQDDDGDAKLSRLMRAVTVDVGASDDDIKADIEELKKVFPDSFKSSKDDDGEDDGRRPAGKGGTRTPSSDPGGTPPKGSKKESKFDAGRERAKARRGAGERTGILADRSST